MRAYTMQALISLRQILIFGMLTAGFLVTSLAHAACKDLADLKLPHTEVSLAQSVSAGKFEAPDGNVYDLPAFCRVHGIARPTAESEIHFEVWMPAKGWTGRYYQQGNGGASGLIDYSRLAGNLRVGNATAGTDDGHRWSGNYLDMWSWARNQPQKYIDWEYRALKETKDNAEKIITAFYGGAPQHNYYSGCSGGGSQALVAAQRFPEDWDGVIVGATSNWANRIIAPYVAQQWLTAPAGRIAPAKLPFIQQKALASCTKDAHVVDGIAADPRFCRYDPAVLSCRGKESANCLTPPQVVTLRKLYEGLRDSKTGRQILFGYAPTGETATSYMGGWARMLTGGGVGLFSSQAVEEPGILEYVVGVLHGRGVEEPEKALMKLDFDGDIALVEQAMEQSVDDAYSLDLSKLAGKGAKLLMYHGWSDEVTPPEGSIEMYERVAKKVGGLKQTQEFYRLFMVPGMTHCHDGPGANAFGQHASDSTAPSLKNDAEHNIHRTLEVWVERERAPNRIIAAKYVDDDPAKGVAFTRPLCPYPQIPVYRGVGSTKEAANFVCKEGVAP